MEGECNLRLDFGAGCTGYVEGRELTASAVREPTVGYHSSSTGVLTVTRKPGTGQYLAGSLTGAVAS